jgi:hypothetical protein
MVDRTIVRAHQHSAGARKKEIKASSAAKGELSPKIHATVDALGNPPTLPSAQARAHDLQGAEVLRAQIAADTLITDKAFDML